jgi:hypothetical protein
VGRVVEMTHDEEMQKMSDFSKNMTKEQARAFIRKISGPPMRTITGDEYDVTMTMLRLKSPVSESNNQRTMTVVYNIGKAVYHITYGLEDEPVLEIMLEDENEL